MVQFAVNLGPAEWYVATAFDSTGSANSRRVIGKLLVCRQHITGNHSFAHSNLELFIPRSFLCHVRTFPGYQQLGCEVELRHTCTVVGIVSSRSTREGKPYALGSNGDWRSKHFWYSETTAFSGSLKSALGVSSSVNSRSSSNSFSKLPPEKKGQVK